MKQIREKLCSGKQQIAILIDPEKSHTIEVLGPLLQKINSVKPDFIFVGGSTVNEEELDACICLIKEGTTIPVVIFPGSHMQVHPQADGILFSLSYFRSKSRLFDWSSGRVCLYS